MKIAITSPNAKTISGHAGKCPGYLIYTIEDNGQLDKTHIKLAKKDIFKNLVGLLSENPQHPLSEIKVFITQSLGEGLLRRLKVDNINVIQTQETDPEIAINRLIK